MNVLEAVALSCLTGVSRVRVTGALKTAAGRDPSGSPSGRALFQLFSKATENAELSARIDRALRRAEQALARAEQAGLLAVSWGDSRYPPLLATISDPPPVVWTSGQAEALVQPGVAIVGSRVGSPYALEAAERLSGDLSMRGMMIVSGLARGVDSAAHRGALAAGGRTIAVLGSGADVIYPSEHRQLARAIEQDGAVVSELLPGTPPRPDQFPRRNRIISGMAVAVVVIEASEKSGSLITAACALEQGRDVMVVPGSILTGRNRGSHALVKDGAKIVESADDILEEVGGLLERHSAHGGRVMTASRDPVLGVLPPGEAYDLDTLAAESGVAPVKLLPRLLELELSGEICRVPGGRFARSRPK